MKNIVNFTSIWLLACLLHSVGLAAQPHAQLIGAYQLPRSLRPGSDFQALGDSSFLLTANGGLYCHNPNGWVRKPDTANWLLSCQGDFEQQSAAYTVYHRARRQTGLYHQYRQGDSLRVEKLALLPGGGYRVLRQQGALFAYGFDRDTFHIFEYGAGGLTAIYSSHEIVPGDVRLLNRNTLLLAFDQVIVSLNRTLGLQEFVRLEAPVRSFVVRNERELWVATADALCVYDAGSLKTAAAGATGALYLENDTLYVLDQEARTVKAFRLSSD